jgi:LysM repeat protein
MKSFFRFKMQGVLMSFAFTLYISTVNSSVLKAQLDPRADCRTITVVSGDSCGALATKCGITAAQFTTFNPSSTLCSTLQVKTPPISILRRTIADIPLDWPTGVLFRRHTP